MKNNLLHISALVLGLGLMIGGCSSDKNETVVTETNVTQTPSFSSDVEIVFAQDEDAEAISFEGTTLGNEEQDTQTNFDSLLK